MDNTFGKVEYANRSAIPMVLVEDPRASARAANLRVNTRVAGVRHLLLTSSVIFPFEKHRQQVYRRRGYI
jgi:hypothetical protein